MFFECKNLISLSLSNFNSEIIINVNSLFYGCSKLISIDLFKFNTKKYC